MAKLIVNPQTSSRKEIELPKADLSIGRDPANDVVIPDALVSRRHARILYDGRGYLFHDCESANGSLLNGNRISERKLSDGDILWLGASRLLFRSPETETVAVVGNLAKVIPHPSSNRMKCPSCAEAFQAGDVFCRHCGSTLEAEAVVSECPSCRARVLGPARFCNACGESLAPGAEREAPAARSRVPASSGAHARADDEPEARPERRLLAAFVDLMAAGALFAIFSLPALGIYLNLENGAALAATMMLVPFASVPAYFVGFWAARGATPGKELLGLRIVMKDDLQPFGVREAWIRFAAFCVSLITFGLGFLMILIDGDTLHDRLAGTRVVERRW